MDKNYPYLQTYVTNPLVSENQFLGMGADHAELPDYGEARQLLPEPLWEGNNTAIAAYWTAWELAFRHLRKATKENGFAAHYIDTAFNDCLFMYDSSFIVLFGLYGRRAFSFQRTLDNFYAKQHPDGFICREIRESDGTDRFHRYDPSGTGPNIMPWAEWEYYCQTGDLERISAVFPALRAFHGWMKAYRTWPDGSYWASGWSGAADNTPRNPQQKNKEADMFHHGHLTWCDACIYQILAAQTLAAMAELLGLSTEAAELRQEAVELAAYVNGKLWDDEAAYYFDRTREGELTGVKNIGAYWALLTGLVPDDRLERFVAHLDNPDEFRRLHRVPSLSADHPAYHPDGDYWVGGVWPPTNYMVLKGLSRNGYDQLAAEIATNHLNHVLDIYRTTGTIWENYAPEKARPGIPAKPDFVGWGGLTPIAVLFEYIFGLRPDPVRGCLVWDVRLTDRHGVRRYPYGGDQELDLLCEARKSPLEKPVIRASSTQPLEIWLKWQGGEERIFIESAVKPCD